jgi:hypothetical protein
MRLKGLEELHSLLLTTQGRHLLSVFYKTQNEKQFNIALRASDKLLLFKHNNRMGNMHTVSLQLTSNMFEEDTSSKELWYTLDLLQASCLLHPPSKTFFACHERLQVIYTSANTLSLTCVKKRLSSGTQCRTIRKSRNLHWKRWK